MLPLYIYEYEILGSFFAPSKLFTSNTILTEDEVLRGIKKIAPQHKAVKTGVPFQFLLNGRKVQITCKEIERGENPARKSHT